MDEKKLDDFFLGMSVHVGMLHVAVKKNETEKVDYLVRLLEEQLTAVRTITNQNRTRKGE